MDGIAALFLSLGLSAVAHDMHTRARPVVVAPPPPPQAEYVAPPAYQPTYAYVPAPSPLPAMGAMTGGMIGAASAGAPGLLLGAATGGLMGSAMSPPAVVQVVPPPPPVAYVPTEFSPPATARRGSQSTEQYIQRWQGSMEPVRAR